MPHVLAVFDYNLQTYITWYGTHTFIVYNTYRYLHLFSYVIKIITAHIAECVVDVINQPGSHYIFTLTQFMAVPTRGTVLERSRIFVVTAAKERHQHHGYPRHIPTGHTYSYGVMRSCTQYDHDKQELLGRRILLYCGTL